MTALEIALMKIKPGSEDAFAEAYRAGRHLLTEIDECRSVRMTRGVESPSTFYLLVEWDSVDAHIDLFRNTDRWVRWRDLIGPHFAEPPVVEHFLDVPGD